MVCHHNAWGEKVHLYLVRVHPLALAECTEELRHFPARERELSGQKHRSGYEANTNAAVLTW